ncbi:MAG: DUF4124 domain-containing protein [Methylophaga sp.]|nr:DUF4124 domain-containing protein [Methylophaga sp.]
MFIQYFHKSFVFFALLFMATSSFGGAYKWVDAEGETNYTQQDPVNIPSELIEPPPPPAIDPVLAQQEIDILIEKQDGSYKENEKERQRIKAQAAEQKKKEEYCRVSKHNLQLYQDNPSRRVIAPDGTVTRLTEESRLAKIAEIQKNIAEHCQ